MLWQLAYPTYTWYDMYILSALLFGSIFDFVYENTRKFGGLLFCMHYFSWLVDHWNALQGNHMQVFLLFIYLDLNHSTDRHTQQSVSLIFFKWTKCNWMFILLWNKYSTSSNRFTITHPQLCNWHCLHFVTLNLPTPSCTFCLSISKPSADKIVDFDKKSKCFISKRRKIWVYDCVFGYCMTIQEISFCTDDANEVISFMCIVYVHELWIMNVKIQLMIDLYHFIGVYIPFRFI